MGGIACLALLSTRCLSWYLNAKVGCSLQFVYSNRAWCEVSVSDKFIASIQRSPFR
jgi:hypothetical protein